MENKLYIEEIFSIIKKHYSTKELPLVSRSQWDKIKKTPYTVLISCLLSLRTKDEITEKVSIQLLSKYDSPKKILQLSGNELEKIIYPVGFYKTKAERIKQISKTLLTDFNGKVPADFKTLLSLKGVGRKTANIVMVYGFNKEDYLPVDTHCHRIPNRLGWISTKNPDETEQELRAILPQHYWSDFNHLFVLFGQTICKPISPYCNTCPISLYCKKKNVIHHR